jgi:hypothetical protein
MYGRLRQFLEMQEILDIVIIKAKFNWSILNRRGVYRVLVGKPEGK